MNGGQGSSSGLETLAGPAVAAVTFVLVTFVIDDAGAALGVAVAGLYLIHVLGLRRLRRSQRRRHESLERRLETLRAGLRSGGAPGAGRRSPSGREGGAPRTEGQTTAAGEADEGLWQGAAPARDVPVPRKFALGTVALIRRKMTPEQIDRTLKEQATRPGEYFGELAVELGFLTEDELERLLETQKEGLFTDGEIQDARRRLKAYQAEKKGAGG